MRPVFFTFIILIVLTDGAGCKDARHGQSNANETPIPDGSIILFKRSNEVAAVVVRNQRMNTEQLDFSWFYRADGRGTFSPGDSAVSTGVVSNASVISFATFSAGWSINTDGKGWVYFSTGPTQLSKTPDYVMCVTAETNVMAIDATDRKWNYRARPRINVRALIDSQIRK